MAIHLEFLGGPEPGRRIPIDAARPRSFKILKHGADAGTVVVELVGDQCVVTNRSQRPVLVNDEERQRSVIGAGDRVVIGKDAFLVVEDEGDTRRIESPAVEVVEPAVGPSSADSDRQRRRRSLSAESTASAAVASEPRPGLLTRVSSALTTRAERGREEELQRQRQDLLVQVGRRALAGERFGLPPAKVAELIAGRPVRIDPSQVDRPALEWWRATRDRLALLDAEIAALRQAIGLGPDPGALDAPNLRGDLKTQEERTYAALDGLSTQDLDGAAALQEEPSASGRRRTPSLRRRLT